MSWYAIFTVSFSYMYYILRLVYNKSIRYSARCLSITHESLNRKIEKKKIDQCNAECENWASSSTLNKWFTCSLALADNSDTINTWADGGESTTYVSETDTSISDPKKVSKYPNNPSESISNEISTTSRNCLLRNTGIIIIISRTSPQQVVGCR